MSSTVAASDEFKARWTRGRYKSAVDAGLAFAWLSERTHHQSGMGIDYEAMAESVDVAEGRPACPRMMRDLYWTRLEELQGVIDQATQESGARDAWVRVRALGWHPEKAARQLGWTHHQITEVLFRADARLEELLASRRMLLH